MSSAPVFGLSVVVPVYNGAGTVGRLAAALEVLTIEGGLELVFVVDGSPDDSAEVCRGLAATAKIPITVVEHARNFGEHNAVMTGLRQVRGAYVVTMDDDLQNPPDEVRRLYDHARLGGYDVVYSYYADKKHQWWRNLGSRFNGWVAGVLMDKPPGLYLCSFRCLSRFLADEVARHEGPFPYVDGLILQTTKSIGTLLVEHLPRAEGGSNYTLRRLIRLWLAMALGFSVAPLRLATLTGIALAALGALGLLLVLAEALFGAPPTGWASLALMLLGLGGVQLVMLGLLGEYVGRAYLTLNRKPQGVIRSVTRGAGGETGGEVGA